MYRSHRDTSYKLHFESLKQPKASKMAIDPLKLLLLNNEYIYSLSQAKNLLKTQGRANAPPPPWLRHGGGGKKIKGAKLPLGGGGCEEPGHLLLFKSLKRYL